MKQITQNRTALRNLSPIAFHARSPQYTLNGAHNRATVLRWTKFPSQNPSYDL